jgi:hypothetical protein
MLGNLSAALSAVVNLALDAEVPQSVIAAELRRYAEMLQPMARERLATAQSCERMSIDPVLDMPVEPNDGSLMADSDESKLGR